MEYGAYMDTPYVDQEEAAMRHHDVCGAQQRVWDWIQSYTKRGKACPGEAYERTSCLRASRAKPINITVVQVEALQQLQAHS